MTVFLIYGMAVIVEKWLHKTKRITRYYATREKHGVLTVSHEPLGWYQQGRKAFFEDRAWAYALVARSLPECIHTVKSESVWIDYEREGWQVTKKRNTPIKRLTAVWFYWANIENWNREPGPSWYAIGNLAYRSATMTRKQFVERFGKGAN